jgi:hypothetical protein
MEPNKAADLLIRASRQLAATAKAFWHRRAAVNDLDRMEAQELRSLARDLGVSADELRALTAKGEHAADLLVRRMKTLGLDPRRVNPAVMHDLQRCCSECTHKGLCIHELEDRPREATWPDYCPNKLTLAALEAGEKRSPASDVHKAIK